MYDLLLAKIPKEKIVFKKKVLKTEQSFEGVSIHCSDNTIYDGDILVGADGAYSAVRQNLYKQLAQEDKLSFSNAEQMNVNFTTMVGTTDPLDPNVFPLVTGESSTQSFMFGKSTSYTANEAIIRDTANFKTPHGTIGSLIEQTPKEYISRLLPSAGQGAVNAMQDAVILANCRYDLTSIHPRNITSAFKDYHEQRHEHVVSQYETNMVRKASSLRRCQPVTQNFHGKGLLKEGAYRPQVTFMPRIPDRGRGASLPQKPSRRYTEEQRDRQPVTI
ncbi:hypothetical protein BG005_010262 [Podila minutissima]|nr:hypothetical protein BG005_010262 [Podila minutissima]